MTIGVHAKSLRANVDPLPVLMALDAALITLNAATLDLPSMRVRVDLHPDVLNRADAPAAALLQ